MIRKFNEYVNEKGFYFGHDEELPGEDRFEESPMERPSKPEMKIGDHDTKELFYELDQAILKLMSKTGLSMGEIMDHIADVAQGYRSSSN
jgi:hypothetical protein